MVLVFYCVNVLALLAVSILSHVSVVLVPVYTCLELYLVVLLVVVFAFSPWLHVLFSLLVSLLVFLLPCSVCSALVPVSLVCRPCFCIFLRCLWFLWNSFPSSVCIWYNRMSTWSCMLVIFQWPEFSCLNLTVYALVKVCQEAWLLCCSTAVFVSCLSACFNICACPRCQQHFCWC